MKLTAESTVLDDKKIGDSFATLQVEADGIRTEVGTKVGNNEVISRINQTAETIKIQADKVNIEGATIFTSGRLSQSSLNNAYDANGSATSAVNGLKTDLSSSSGTTVINGGHIETGTLNADRIVANTIDASKLTIGVRNDINSNRRNFARLLHRVGSTTTASGITSTVASDFAICANGTATATSYVLGTSTLVDITLEAGSYVIWCTNATLNHLRLGQGPSSSWLAEPRPTKASPYKLTLNASTRITVGVIYDNGTTYSNVKTYLMIERGDTPSEWIPALEDTDVNSYVTHIDNNGIRIHPSSTENNSVVINASGMEVFKGGTAAANSVAFYGDTARIGKAESQNAGNVYIDNDSVDIKKGSTVLSTFTASGAELGRNSDTATISLAGNSGEITGYKWSNTATNDSYNLIIRNNKTVASTGYKALVLDCSHTNHNSTGITMSVGEYQGDPTDTIYLFADNEMVQVMNGGVFVSSTASSPLNRIGLSSLGQASLELKIADDGDAHGIWTGQMNRWLIGAVNDGYVFSPGVQANTTSGGANVRVQDDIGYLKRYASSSRRYKEDIDDISDESLDPNRLYDLRVAQFRYKEDYLDYDDQRYGKLVNGFIAEEVEEAYPIAVQYEDEMVEDWEPKFIIPPMLKLIQDQKKKIDELEQRLEALERS